MVAWLLVDGLLLHGYTVPSASMEDTLLRGDALLVETVTYAWRDPQVGELVVFQSPAVEGQTLIKRCVAVAGERVEVRDKAVYVDGERLPDPRRSKYLDARILPASRSRRDNLAPSRVPESHLFVMGDNRDSSRDSRQWGVLSLDSVVGRPVTVYFSAAPADSAQGWWGRLSTLSSRLRWERLGAAIE